MVWLYHWKKSNQKYQGIHYAAKSNTIVSMCSLLGYQPLHTVSEDEYDTPSK